MRAVHLELTTSLSTESCVLALKRFFARRGTPHTFYSDNAKTSKRVSKELPALAETLKSEVLMNYVLQNYVQWKFIVEIKPWRGDFWERLIRRVKDLLKINIRRATLNYEQMNTLSIEIENTI